MHVIYFSTSVCYHISTDREFPDFTYRGSECHWMVPGTCDDEGEPLPWVRRYFRRHS